jgi:hypothetical protein
MSKRWEAQQQAGWNRLSYILLFICSFGEEGMPPEFPPEAASESEAMAGEVSSGALVPTFSENLQAGLTVLDEHAPEYAQLIRNGTLTLEEGPMIGKAAGIRTNTGMIISPDPAYPGSTAAAIYEEIVHSYQGAMQKLAAEIEAKSAAAEWVMKNSISITEMI